MVDLESTVQSDPWTSAAGTGTREFQQQAVHTEAPDRCAGTRKRRQLVSTARVTRGRVRYTSAFDAAELVRRPVEAEVLERFLFFSLFVFCGSGPVREP
jgi:hypothetical protein